MMKCKVISPFGMGGRKFIVGDILEVKKSQLGSLLWQGLVIVNKAKQKAPSEAPKDKMVKTSTKKRKKVRKNK